MEYASRANETQIGQTRQESRLGPTIAIERMEAGLLDPVRDFAQDRYSGWMRTSWFKRSGVCGARTRALSLPKGSERGEGLVSIS